MLLYGKHMRLLATKRQGLELEAAMLSYGKLEEPFG